MKLEASVLKSLLTNPRLDPKGTNFYCKCPWCGFNEFGISLNDGHRFGCFRKKDCGEEGNIFKFLKKIDRLDILSGGLLLNYTGKLENILEDKIKKAELDLTVPKTTLPIGCRRVYSNVYLEGRNFTEFEQHKVYETKIDPDYKNYVIFAVEQQGELKGYVARHTWEKEAIDEYNRRYFEQHEIKNKLKRYNNSQSLFSKIVYGLEEITEQTEEVIIVEGLMDKFNVDRLLRLLGKSDSIKCVCTFGAKVSPEQIFQIQLRGVRNIMLMFDPDVIHKLKKYALELMIEFESVRVGIHSTKDPGDLNKEELAQIFETAESALSFNNNKVRILSLH